MLAKLNVRYVIVGHSERREILGETDEFVNKKVRAVLGAGMQPILCVGETLEEREAGETEAKVKRQVEAGFADIAADAADDVVVAYEPIWAIGTGRTATSEDANATIGTIRTTIRGLFGGVADAVRILYGGSVKVGNTAELMTQPEIDGALVGGASLEPDDFARIIQYGR
jgi:triosephosphate isomerase